MAVDQVVADPGQIQIPAPRQLFVFVEDLRRGVKGKQAGCLRAQMFFQALCEIHCDRPVRTRFTRCDDRAADVGNAPFGVGHRAVLFAPTGGGQQQVGITWRFQWCESASCRTTNGQASSAARTAA